MPAYVYKCKTCEFTYEKKKKFSDPHDTSCPECGKEIRRVINSVGIVFKGSGFYVNDSKSNNSAASSPSANGANGNGTEKSETSEKGEGTAAKKAESADSSSSPATSAKKESTTSKPAKAE